MTTFEITIIVLLAAVVVLLVVLLRTAIEGFHGVWQKLDANWEQLRKIETHANFLPDISRQLDNIEGNAIDEMEDFTQRVEGILNDLAINVKGNYNTLEQQQESLNYIRMRINHILSLMRPAEEVTDYKERYKRIGESEWFKKHYENKSLGDIEEVKEN